VRFFETDQKKTEGLGSIGKAAENADSLEFVGDPSLL